MTGAAISLSVARGDGEARKLETGNQSAAINAEEDARHAPAPRILKTIPEVGAKGVDAALAEVTVVFDRDMAKGMSWTGDPALFPSVDKSREARWADARTCVLPVKLEQGKFYRLGINSTSRQNFRSAGGAPVAASAIYFVTAGATREIEERLTVPAVVSLDPQREAADVDPKTTSLKVTFNVPMAEGMSWVGGGALFPKLPQDKKASWSEDRLTCTLPVALEPSHEYELGLNSASFNNFQSRWGVPLEPVIYKFHTGPAK